VEVTAHAAQLLKAPAVQRQQLLAPALHSPAAQSLRQT